MDNLKNDQYFVNAGIVAITGNGNMAAGGSVLQADVL